MSMFIEEIFEYFSLQVLYINININIDIYIYIYIFRLALEWSVDWAAVKKQIDSVVEAICYFGSCKSLENRSRLNSSNLSTTHCNQYIFISVHRWRCMYDGLKILMPTFYLSPEKFLSPASTLLSETISILVEAFLILRDVTSWCFAIETN